MADTKRVVSVKLRFEFDKSTFANVRENTRALQQELARLDRQRTLSQAAADAAKFVAEGGSAQAAVARLNAELTKLDATADEVRKVAREFDALRESAQNAADAASEVGEGGRRRPSRLTRLGTGLRGLPSVDLGGGISTDLIGKLVAVIGGLSPIAIGAAAAMAGLGLVLSGLTSQAKKAQEAAAQTLDAQERARLIIQTSSAEEIRAKRAAAEANLARALEEERLATELSARFRQEIQNTYGALGLAVVEFNKTLGTGSGELAAVDADLKKAQDAVAAARAELNVYSAAMNDTSFAAKEAAENERRLAEARQKYLDAFVSAEVRALLEARNIQSTADLDKRVQSLREERQLYVDIISARGLSEEAQQAYLDKIRDIDAAVQVFTRRGLVAEIQSREREREAIERAKRAREELIARQNAVAKAQVDAARAGDAYRAALDKIAADASGKLAAAARERQKALVQAENDAIKARADALKTRDNALNEAARKAQENREKLERDHQKRLAEIQRRGALDYQRALEERDAVAAARAQEAAAEAAREEGERYSEQRAEINRALQEQTAQINARYQEQTAQINARLAEQRAAIDARYAEQVESIRAAAAQARAAEQQAYQQRLATLVQQLQEQTRISAQGAAAALGIQRQYWQGTLALVQQAAASVEALRARASAASAATAQGARLTGPTRAAPALIGGTRGMRAFDTGGYITRTGAAVVHAGEYILNPARGQYPVNFAPTVNVSGSGGVEQIRQVLHAEVERFAARLQQGAF